MEDVERYCCQCEDALEGEELVVCCERGEHEYCGECFEHFLRNTDRHHIRNGFVVCPMACNGIVPTREVARALIFFREHQLLQHVLTIFQHMNPVWAEALRRESGGRAAPSDAAGERELNVRQLVDAFEGHVLVASCPECGERVGRDPRGCHAMTCTECHARFCNFCFRRALDHDDSHQHVAVHGAEMLFAPEHEVDAFRRQWLLWRAATFFTDIRDDELRAEVLLRCTHALQVNGIEEAAEGAEAFLAAPVRQDAWRDHPQLPPPREAMNNGGWNGWLYHRVQGRAVGGDEGGGGGRGGVAEFISNVLRAMQGTVAPAAEKVAESGASSALQTATTSTSSATLAAAKAAARNAVEEAAIAEGLRRSAQHAVGQSSKTLLRKVANKSATKAAKRVLKQAATRAAQAQANAEVAKQAVKALEKRVAEEAAARSVGQAAAAAVVSEGVEESGTNVLTSAVQLLSEEGLRGAAANGVFSGVLGFGIDFAMDTVPLMWAGNWDRLSSEEYCAKQKANAKYAALSAAAVGTSALLLGPATVAGAVGCCALSISARLYGVFDPVGVAVGREGMDERDGADE